MPGCSVPGCRNRKSKDGDKVVKFFRFPNQEDWCKEWVKAINRADEGFNIKHAWALLRKFVDIDKDIVMNCGSRNKCRFIGCSRSRYQFPSLHFFRFPVHRREICYKWIVNCANPALSLMSYKSLVRKVVCEKHFTEDSFLSLMKTRLKSNAVPTLRCDYEKQESMEELTSDQDNDPEMEIKYIKNLPILRRRKTLDETGLPSTNEATYSLNTSEPTKTQAAPWIDTKLSPTLRRSVMRSMTSHAATIYDIKADVLKGSGAKCCFNGCGVTQRKCPSLHFFRFPVRRPSICEQWLINCGNEDLISLPDKTLYTKKVCEKHFTSECFTNDIKKYLKKDAIPTILLGDDIEDGPDQRSSSGTVSSGRGLESSNQAENIEAKENEGAKLPATQSSLLRCSSTPKTPTSLHRIYKNLKERTPTPKKKVLTSIKRGLLKKISISQKNRRKYQARAKRLSNENRKITKTESVASMKEHLPSAVSSVSPMQLNQTDSKIKPWSEEESHMFLTMSYKSPRDSDDEAASFKQEELILEDYEFPEGNLEYHASEELRNNEEDCKNIPIGHAHHSKDIASPFETVICGSVDIKIKQEITQDETDVFEGSNETDSLVNPSELTDTLSSTVAQSAVIDTLPSNSFTILNTGGSSDTMPQLISKPVSSPLNKSFNQKHNIIQVRAEAKLQQRVPELGFERCKICINEFFTSHEDLMEHYILKHSDASTNMPVTEPKVSPSPSPTTATTPGQPPNHPLPPHISEHDVINGVYVSLANIRQAWRKPTKNKILELVKLISDGNIDPKLINFSVMTK